MFAAAQAFTLASLSGFDLLLLIESTTEWTVRDRASYFLLCKVPLILTTLSKACSWLAIFLALLG